MAWGMPPFHAPPSFVHVVSHIPGVKWWPSNHRGGSESDVAMEAAWRVAPRARVSHRRSASDGTRRRGKGQVCASRDPEGMAKRKASKEDRPPRALRILSAFLRTGGAPAASYVPRPRGPLHLVDANVKLLWLVFLLAVLPRADLAARATAASVLAALALFTRASRRTMPRLLLLALFSALLALLAGSTRPPPAATRAPTPEELRLVGMDVGPTLMDAPSQARHVLPGWLARFSKVAWTRAGAVFVATYTTTQSASLMLATTPPDALARATVGACFPFAKRTAQELELTLLLSIRFLAVVAGEVRAMALGVASRGVSWRTLRPTDGMAMAAKVVQRVVKNLEQHAKDTARAMKARGFVDPWQHQILRTDRRLSLADAVAVALLVVVATVAFAT